MPGPLREFRTASDERAGPGNEASDGGVAGEGRVVGVPKFHSCSGVARTSRMLGHSMGTLRLYELLREVQKHLRGLGLGMLPQKMFRIS